MLATHHSVSFCQYLSLYLLENYCFVLLAIEDSISSLKQSNRLGGAGKEKNWGNDKNEKMKKREGGKKL